MMTSLSDPEIATQETALWDLGPPVKCVFLPPSESEFRAATGVVNTTRITLYHAATLEQAAFQLTRTGANVLLAELAVPDGSWEDALQMLSLSYPRVVLVVAAARADERLRIHVLERGAFDLIEKPFRTDELQRSIESADAYSKTHSTGGTVSQPDSDLPGRTRPAGSS
jgi:DNA-binding response OmpR family regulator